MLADPVGEGSDIIRAVDVPPLSRSQRAADAVTEFCGSWPFIIAFSGITLVWMSLNTFFILFGVFDPYPYILLNLFLTVISTFQSPLIMMSQNRQTERDREAVQGLHAKLDAMAARLDSQREVKLRGYPDLKSHVWTGCQQGGSPSELGTYEWVRFCSVCGMEDTCEDPLPPCPGALNPDREVAQ